MKLLAIDTSTEACSAALLVGGEVAERYELAPRGHARLLLAMAERLLAEAGLVPAALDGIAVGRGPGSFTGVRIAVGVGQGIAFAADLPALPVSSLAALAQGGIEEGAERLFAAIDARMGEVYWGEYRRGAAGLAQLHGEERVLAPVAVSCGDGPPGVGVGSGWMSYGEALAARLGAAVTGWRGDRFPRAGAVARLGAAALAAGQGVAAEALLPLYLRDRVAWRKG